MKLTRETGDNTLESFSSLHGLICGLHASEKLLLAAFSAISFALKAVTLSSLLSDNDLFIEMGRDADIDEEAGVVA